jgi:arylsulfatase
MLHRSAWALGLVALLGAACSRDASTAGVDPCSEISLSPAPAGPAAHNVIIIVNDTMRRDRMGAYGGPAETPAFDVFAAQNLLFEHAFTQAPWTKPSIATLFTSLYPSQHGVASDPQFRNPRDMQRSAPLIEADVLSGELETLPEVMQAAGYRTAAFIANPWMEKRFGFAQGFEVYDDSFAQWGVRGDVVSRSALDWLNQQAPGTKFFVYLHYLDSHMPYGVLDRQELARRSAQLAADTRPLSEPAALAVKTLPRFADRVSPLAEGYRPTLSLVEMSYDSGVHQFDTALATFLDGFAKHWAFDNTAIIITSDHGEALFERGYGNHGNGLFDEEVAIPLAARFPGTRAEDKRITCPVGLIDVMPSLCTYLSLSCPRTMFGTSFISAPGGRDRERRYIVSEGVAQRPGHRAIRNQTYKLIWETEVLADGKKKENPYSLYDLTADPLERNDLLNSANRNGKTERVFTTLSAALRDAVPPFAGPHKTYAPVDPQTRERLRALGYAD